MANPPNTPHPHPHTTKDQHPTSNILPPPLLLIFIKNPELGKAKTRVAKTTGDEAALRIYMELLDITRNVTLAVKADRFLFYSQHVDEGDAWPNDQFIKKLQDGEDLGERMAHAFEKGFQQHQKVVIIGSDCAALSPYIINMAFEKLDEKDFVLGPATDGGYYLLGMNTFEPSVFENIDWSTEKVATQTIHKMLSLKKSIFLLPELTDIDKEQDWADFQLAK